VVSRLSAPSGSSVAVRDVMAEFVEFVGRLTSRSEPANNVAGAFTK
jgi:hypothetical protein